MWKKIHPTTSAEASKYQLSKPIGKHGCIINAARSLPGAPQTVQAFRRKYFCEVLLKIMTVSVLNRNKWLLRALGTLGASSCFPEQGRGPPPAEDRRAGSGPLKIDCLIIQDNRNPWLFQHGTAPSSWAFHHPNELLEELDAKMSSSKSQKTGTQTVAAKSAPLQLRGHFLILPLSSFLFFLLLPASCPLFFPCFHHFHFFHLFVYKNTRLNAVRKKSIRIAFLCKLLIY